MRLAGKLKSLPDVSTAERRAMLELMRKHYDRVDAAAFAADLAEKDWVIQVVDPATAELCGFSTQKMLAVQVAGRTVHALFSGDTIVDRRHWGDPALSHCWGHLALSLIDAQAPGDELYWFLISQGFRTYRFLPAFFHEYYPHVERPTPAWAAQVFDALATDKFGSRYDTARGIVRSSAEHYRLNSDLGQIDLGRLHDRHVRFFLERNPLHAEGDELCCLAPLSRENFTPAAYRVIGPQVRFEERICRSPVG